MQKHILLGNQTTGLSEEGAIVGVIVWLQQFPAVHNLFYQERLWQPWDIGMITNIIKKLIHSLKEARVAACTLDQTRGGDSCSLLTCFNHAADGRSKSNGTFSVFS